MRHSPDAPGLGLDAMIADKFGREASGIGGGTPGAGIGLVVVGRLTGTGGGDSVALLRPNDSADLRGGGTACVCPDSFPCDAVGCLAGRLGRDGSLGGSVRSGTTFGDDFVDFKAARVAEGSSVTFLGGRGGSIDGSYAGARTVYNWPPFDAVLALVLVDPVDLTDQPEAIVDTDSDDPRLLKLCSDDFLEGSGGGGAC